MKEECAVFFLSWWLKQIIKGTEEVWGRKVYPLLCSIRAIDVFVWWNLTRAMAVGFNNPVVDNLCIEDLLLNGMREDKEHARCPDKWPLLLLRRTPCAWCVPIWVEKPWLPDWYIVEQRKFTRENWSGEWLWFGDKWNGKECPVLVWMSDSFFIWVVPGRGRGIFSYDYFSNHFYKLWGKSLLGFMASWSTSPTINWIWW